MLVHKISTVENLTLSKAWWKAILNEFFYDHLIDSIIDRSVLEQSQEHSFRRHQEGLPTFDFLKQKVSC